MNKTIIICATALLGFTAFAQDRTATKRGDGKHAVKGGAFDSKRTDCRTEAKNTAKDASKGHPNVTIRLVRESK